MVIEYVRFLLGSCLSCGCPQGDLDNLADTTRMVHRRRVVCLLYTLSFLWYQITLIAVRRNGVQEICLRFLMQRHSRWKSN